MQSKGFSTSFAVDQSPKEVFEAVNNVRGWWSENLDGNADELGATFKFQYKDIHRSTQKITELVSDKKVVWHVIDSRLNFVEDKAEWRGTDIVFEISKKNGKTELQFTHVGIVPEIECYDKCSRGWSIYVGESLRSLITTGKGSPAPSE